MMPWTARRRRIRQLEQLATTASAYVREIENPEPDLLERGRRLDELVAHVRETQHTERARGRGRARSASTITKGAPA